MNSKYFLLILLIMLLVGCGNSPQIFESDLGLVIAEEGELPSGFSEKYTLDVAPPIYINLPLPLSQRELYVQLQRNGILAEGIAIFFYDTKEDAEYAFQVLVDGLYTHSQDYERYATVLNSGEVGEKAITQLWNSSTTEYKMLSTDVAFLRCRTVVDIGMADINDLESVMTYAKKLDYRIKNQFCP